MSRFIFISYRNDDCPESAQRICSELRGYFQYREYNVGPVKIFWDKDSISPGDDWFERIQDALDCSEVLVAVIGPRWTTAQDGTEEARIRNMDDVLRLEIRQALQRRITVIPVLVRGAQMPAERTCPRISGLCSATTSSYSTNGENSLMCSSGGSDAAGTCVGALISTLRKLRDVLPGARIQTWLVIRAESRPPRELSAKPIFRRPLSAGMQARGV